jgi:hypothetical protein
VENSRTKTWTANMELPGFAAPCFEAVLSHFLMVGLSVLQVFAFYAVHLYT